MEGILSLKTYEFFSRKLLFTSCFLILRLEGKGSYTFPTNTRYEGELRDGAFHGKGTLHFENGAKYEATWVNGVSVDVL